jgi:hypothetical protein
MSGAQKKSVYTFDKTASNIKVMIGSKIEAQGFGDEESALHGIWVLEGKIPTTFYVEAKDGIYFQSNTLTGETHKLEDGKDKIEFREFIDFGWVAVADDDKLFKAVKSDDGVFDEYSLLTAPENQGVLDAINKVYETKYRLEDFMTDKMSS